MEINEKPEIRYLMDEKTKRSNDFMSAAQKIYSLLRGYSTEGPVVALPDFTDSNTLPIGTTVIISGDMPINPAFIGMDIGCGYSFFSVQMNPKRFFKKGKLKIGCIEAVVSAISQNIKQQKTAEIGRGNHFIDLFVVEETNDRKTCEDLGLVEDRVYFMIHSGSGRKGFETYSRFSGLFKGVSQGYTDQFNQQYLSEFDKTRGDAVENRDNLRKMVVEALSELGVDEKSVHSFYDKPHNDIDIQKNGGLSYKLKKGTSTLFPGELFVIPGTAIGSAYAIVGDEGLPGSYLTINHGAGRKYTRQQTFTRYRRADLDKIFQDVVLNVSPKKMVEEVPNSYKKMDDIMSSIEKFKLGRKIARLRPVGVIVDRREKHGRN